MNNEELQEKFEELASTIDWIKTKLIDLLEEKGLAPVKAPYEVKVPDDIGDYYFVNECGAITLLKDVFFSVGYEKVYLRGLAFKTKEEAERYDKERLLIQKMKDWGKKYNGVWEPNWKDFDEEKCTVMYDNGNKNFDTYETYIYRDFTKLPVFKSEEIAEQFTEEFGEEIKEVFF